MAIEYPTPQSLHDVLVIKYGFSDNLGWGPALKRRLGYFSPDDIYEALVMNLVDRDTRWLDIGCGRDMFPSNRPLAQLLAGRCARLVGVDPDVTILENPFLHHRVRTHFESYETDETFNLVTMRMVAEHVRAPESVIQKLRRCVAQGGYVVIYTVNGRSPVPLLTRLVPMSVRHLVKRILWGTDKKDTFPTFYRMNSRRGLRRLFELGGFREEFFAYLDDCRTFSRFRVLFVAEVLLSKLLNRMGFRYPENCLLAVYARNRQ